jgi:outer membrane protein TolC
LENNEKYRIEVLSLKENIETLETKIKSQNKRYEDERKRNDQRETELLEKLSNEQNLLSQSQQLQLLTEQRLHDAENRIKLLESPKQEQKKGFWARLFG